ncbi:MAG TPA: hypothetical protein VGL73_04745, partial [Caulobacteraceae bacterium]
MTDEILIAGLKRKYGELAGQLRATHKAAHDLKHSMATIKATLKLFDAEGELIGVKVIAPPLAGTWFRHGQCSRAVLDVLRTAPAPMTVREIAEAVMAVCELPKGDRTAFVATREGVRYALRM